MKVSEAIEILKEADPDAELFLSADEEGNSYRRANISIGEKFCDQQGWLTPCAQEDIENGEFGGWEDSMFDVVVIW